MVAPTAGGSRDGAALVGTADALARPRLESYMANGKAER